MKKGLYKKQRGISMIIVIFLLAVVSVMTLSMMKLAGTQHISSLNAARAAQAYFSARSAVEYALGAMFANADRVAACTAANGTSITVQGFSVAITCASSAQFDEGSTPYRIYSLTATASGGNFQVPNLVNRQVQASVRF